MGILFLTSCQPKNLVFKEFNNLALDQLSFAGAAIKLNVVCYNPNSFGLQLNRTDFDIYIDSTYFGHSSQDMQIAVPRKRDFTVPIKVNLDIKNLLKNGITSYFNKNVKDLLTAGDTAPVIRSLQRMLAMRSYQRSKHVDNEQNLAVLEQAGLTVAEVEEMYHIMAIANYEDRFVIPTSHREYAENAFDMRGGCGFTFGNGCSDGASDVSLFGGNKKRTIPIKVEV